MRSTFGGLNTMVRGINANQLALDTVGHNVTNANTQGYSRQRVNQGTTGSLTVYGLYGGNQLGTGVDTSSILRARDSFADRQYWRDSSNTANAKARQTGFDKLESIFDDTDDAGIQNALNEFWQSWKTLGNDASEYSTRVVVRDRGKALVENVQRSTKQLQDLIEDNNNKLELKLDSVNQITKDIASLNEQIFKSETGGGAANDLRDSRDLLVDKLSALVNVNVKEQSNGKYAITCGGNILVSEGSYTELATKSFASEDYGVRDIRIVAKDTGTAFDIGNGELKGIQDSTDNAKGYLDDLALMAGFLLTDFNAQHSSGYGQNDETGVNFFGEDGEIDPVTLGGSVRYHYNPVTKKVIVSNSSTTAGPANGRALNTIETLKALKVNSRFEETDNATGAKGTDLIAAKTQPVAVPPNNTEGTAGNTNALLLGELIGTTESAMLGNTPLTGYYKGMMGELGIAAQATDREVLTQENMMGMTGNLRDSTAGVNTQEELTDMIRFTEGFKACSRCLTAMDEMLEKLINGTGLVGR